MKKTLNRIRAEKAERPLPCPCCGNKKLYIGPIESTVQGVQCEPHVGGCGLQLGRRYPNKVPKLILKKFCAPDRANQTLRALKVYCLNLAIAAWNRRGTV